MTQGGIHGVGELGAKVRVQDEVIRLLETVSDDNVRSEGAPHIIQVHRLPVGDEFGIDAIAETIHMTLDVRRVLSYLTFREEGVERATTQTMKTVLSSSERGHLIVEAVLKMLELVRVARLRIQGIVESGILDVYFVWTNTHDRPCNEVVSKQYLLPEPCRHTVFLVPFLVFPHELPTGCLEALIVRFDPLRQRGKPRTWNAPQRMEAETIDGNAKYV